MYCEHCGKKLNVSDKFCTKCGQSVIQPDQTNQTLKTAVTSLNEKWWHRLLKILYIIAHLPLLGMVLLVWSENTPSCYYSSCSGSYSEAFWYSILTIIIYLVILRLIKLAVNYVVVGQKPIWKKEFKKLF